ncbi:MAG: hypothetical protein FWD49_05840 [Firmicutes bacterium]|nr:hypothetical protein [Bacillota bacterium]
MSSKKKGQHTNQRILEHDVLEAPENRIELALFSDRDVIIPPGGTFPFNAWGGEGYTIQNTVRMEGENKNRKVASATSQWAHYTSALTSIEFEVIYTIDTNSDTINGVRSHIGVLVKWLTKVEDGQRKFSSPEILTRCQVCKCEPPCIKKPENFMWSYLLTSLKEKGSLDIDKKTAVVVDSDEENHTSYNDGSDFTSEVSDGFIKTLPKNFTLVYASSDRSGTSFNELFKMSESIAKSLMKELKKTKADTEQGILDAYQACEPLLPKIYENYKRSKNKVRA